MIIYIYGGGGYKNKFKFYYFIKIWFRGRMMVFKTVGRGSSPLIFVCGNLRGKRGFGDFIILFGDCYRNYR